MIFIDFKRIGKMARIRLIKTLSQVLRIQYYNNAPPVCPFWMIARFAARPDF